MARKPAYRAVENIDPEALAAFQRRIRRRYSDEAILAELKACAERLRALADDARVRRRPEDEGAPADGDRALRQLERGEAAGGARAAPLRDPGGAARPAPAAGRAAGSHADGQGSRRQPALDAVEVALLAHLRLAHERACARPASTCRWGRSGSSAPSTRERRWRARSAGCRSSPTGAQARRVGFARC